MAEPTHFFWVPRIGSRRGTAPLASRSKRTGWDVAFRMAACARRVHHVSKRGRQDASTTGNVRSRRPPARCTVHCTGITVLYTVLQYQTRAGRCCARWCPRWPWANSLLWRTSSVLSRVRQRRHGVARVRAQRAAACAGPVRRWWQAAYQAHTVCRHHPSTPVVSVVSTLVSDALMGLPLPQCYERPSRWCCRA